MEKNDDKLKKNNIKEEKGEFSLELEVIVFFLIVITSVINLWLIFD